MAARPYQQHGLHTLKRRLKVRGLDGIDKRTATARALLGWRREIEADLGGPENLSAQQRAVVDVASTTKLLLDSVDRWLLEQGDGLVNRKRRAMYPVVLQRQQLADALARYMAMLGLERRRPPAPALEDYIRDKFGSAGGAEHNRQAEAEAP